MDIQAFQARLAEVKMQLENGEYDEIPLDARPPMPEFDCNKESYVVISYSRKDFREVYLFLAYLAEKGYRFWYDDGMIGTDKWIEEYKRKYENPNCLGTVTFFSKSYVSNSTKEELEVIYSSGYTKQNLMVSLIPLDDINPEKLLADSISAGRITIPNAATIQPLLTELISAEKDKTIHRYASEADIEGLIQKIGKVFDTDSIAADEEEQIFCPPEFQVFYTTLKKYQPTPDEEDGKLPSDEYVPRGIKAIGEKAFSEARHLERISLPSTLQSIERQAFRGLNALTEVIFPQSLKTIGEAAFADCPSLEYVSIPNDVTSIGDYAFKNCTALTSITIPSSVKRIGKGAFAGCESLKTLKIEEGVVNVDESAFEDCVNLEKVSLPHTLIHMGAKAFANCRALKNVVLPIGLTEISEELFEHCALESITLSKKITSIGAYAFQYCPLKSVLFSDGLITIGKGAFSMCNNLKEITLPETVEEIGAGAFKYCCNLHKLTLSEKLQTIGYSAFYGCHELCELSLPHSINSIGMAAFSRCSSLRSVTLPKALTVLEEEVFSMCHSLKSVIFPEKLFSIGEAAFYDCFQLSVVTLPSSIKMIERAAFKGCHRLDLITFQGTKYSWARAKKEWSWRGKIKYVKCTDGVKRIFF